MNRFIFSCLAFLVSFNSVCAEFRVYVTNRDNSNLNVIDTSTGTQVLPNLPSGGNSPGIATTSDGKFAYVVNSAANTVSKVDLVTRSIVSTINVGNTPHGIAITPDGKCAYVANHESASVSKINLATENVTTIPLTGLPVVKPWKIAITPDGSFAYVTNIIGDTVNRIDLNTNLEDVVLPGFSTPDGIAITPDGTFAYVTNLVGSNLAKITLSTNVILNIGIGASSLDVAITPDGTKAYFTKSNNSVGSVDVSSNAQDPDILIGIFSENIAITPDGASAYVTNISHASVTKIDLGTATPMTLALTGANSPLALAIAPVPTATTPETVIFLIENQ